MAWALFAWAQDALDRNKAGFLIKRLLADEDNRRPPERFLAFAELTWGDWGELWRLIEPYSQKGIYDLPEALRPIAPMWLQVYYPRRSEIFPAGILEKLEAMVSTAYDESETNDD